jgi:hypothetical protein
MNWGIGFEKVGSIRIIIIIEWYGEEKQYRRTN